MPTRRASDDQPFLFELPGDGHDFLLRLFHVAQPDSAEHFHLFAQHVGGSLGHVYEESIPDLLARAFERHGQHFLVRSLDDLAESVVLEMAEIVEHEHQVADRHRQIRRIGLDRFEHRLADVTVEAIEQLGHRAHAAVLFTARTAERPKALIDDR